MDSFLSAFLPLFVAIDAVGIVPLFMSLTDGYGVAARRRLALQAVTTALGVSIVIIFAGQAVFRALGITVSDLRVGGGLILLILAISDLLFGENRQRSVEDDGEAAERGAGVDIGIVPLGIPLVAGPAAITTLIISQRAYGTGVTVLSLAANLVIVLVAFWYGPWLLSKLGASASKAIAKVVNLFLAAIAVAMIRTGIVEMIQAYGR